MYLIFKHNKKDKVPPFRAYKSLQNKSQVLHYRIAANARTNEKRLERKYLANSVRA
jgi:hypothetical protein